VLQHVAKLENLVCLQTLGEFTDGGVQELAGHRALEETAAARLDIGGVSGDGRRGCARVRQQEMSLQLRDIGRL
jgi:hypothetical protein